jgi:hypothetical protein
VGFVFSMIVGHAPVVFPSVSGISIPYRPSFYVHVALLHGALPVRVAGDLTLLGPLRRWGRGDMSLPSFSFWQAPPVVRSVGASTTTNLRAPGRLLPGRVQEQTLLRRREPIPTRSRT